MKDFLPVLLSFVFSLIVTRAMLIELFASKSLDVPGERSLHVRPTPRLGGIGVLSGVVAGWLLLHFGMPLKSEFIFLAGAAFLIATVSVADDFMSLSQTGRFFVHSVACAIVIAGTVFESSGWLQLAFYAVATIWLINLYNFMDGMDGFSGGMAVIGFAALGLSVWLSGDDDLAIALWVVSASALGFLVFNFPPARIFMGDVGSATLGFLVAGFSLWGIKENTFSIWLPLLIFSPFIVDASITILRRAFNREKIWLPHRKHFYQRLVQDGWSHRRTVLCEYVLMLLCSASAIIMHLYDLAIPGLVAWSFIYLILAILVEKKVKKKVPF